MKKIGVVGAGTMGSGIIQTFAEKGFDVLAFESYAPARSNAQNRIEKGIRKRVEKKQMTAEDADQRLAAIRWCEDISELSAADFAVEAIIEDFNAKCDVFRQLDALMRPEVILGSNTSSISITKIARIDQARRSLHRNALHESLYR